MKRWTNTAAIFLRTECGELVNLQSILTINVEWSCLGGKHILCIESDYGQKIFCSYEIEHDAYEKIEKLMDDIHECIQSGKTCIVSSHDYKICHDKVKEEDNKEPLASEFGSNCGLRRLKSS